MRFFVFIIIILLFKISAANGGFGESIAQKINRKPDTNKVNALNDLCFEYRLVSADSALMFGEMVLKLAEDLKFRKGIAQACNDLAIIYMDKKEYPKAIKLFSESLEIRKRLGDNKGISSTLSLMGALYTQMGLYCEASVALHRSLALSKQISVIDEEMSALLGLAKLKALTNQADSAILLMKLYIAAKDSVYDERIKQQILEVQSKYETEKLEQDLEMAKQVKQFTEINLIRRKTQIWLLVFIIISMTGAGMFLFYRHQHRQKDVADADKIRQQEARMNAVFQAQEEDHRRIAKELHDGVGQTLGALKINYQSLSFKATSRDLAQDLKRLHTMLDSASAQIHTISHQMMPVELEQFGLVPAIENLLKMKFENATLQYHFDHSGFEERIGYQIELTLYRVFQELINNIIKHSQATFLNVQLLKLKTHVALIVYDNGLGFNIEATEKKGTGLLNIASRIDSIKGNLHYESSPGTGTSVTIRTPIA